MFQPEFQGIRSGSLFRKDRALQIQVAAPAAFGSEEEMKEWLGDALTASVAEARETLRRRKIDWSVEPAASLANELISRLGRSADPELGDD
jgi:hypothetical protein